MKNSFQLSLQTCLLLTLSLIVAACNNTIREIETGNDLNPGGDRECRDGIALDTYACKNIHLLSQLSPTELLGSRLNDIWGWTDPQNGDEYAIVGLTDGVTFVRVTNPGQPVVIGELTEIKKEKNTTGEGKSSWRDFKVYRDHLFIVSDGQPHGMQVFDLTRLRAHDGSNIVNFNEDAHFTGFDHAHNIAINTETGYAYVAGSGHYGGGLMILDITNPLQPKFAGFHADSSVGRNSTGYVHDTQCVNYHGPDTGYTNWELCINASETHIVIADVTDKDSTYTIGKSDYPGRGYVHQGWLTEDHRYFLLDDELDEKRDFHKTKTYIWDLQDLENPVLTGTFESTNSTIDHNQYIKGSYSYQANYTAGLRILDLGNISQGELKEVAYFDTYPADNAVEFEGAWSTYPFFESGIILVSDISNGLFVLGPDL